MANWDKQIRTWATKTPAARKIIAGVIATILATLLLLAFFYGAESEYRLLFRDLEPEDASQVVDFLKMEKIPYRLAGSGRTILVVEDRLDGVKLQLASKGLPKNKVAGWELFDHNSFGTTEFAQQINYTRALQGELSRTIGHLEGVQTATVHIARPKPSIFQRKPQPVTASIVLHVKPGYQLNSRQTYGIAYLVSNAVEGLGVDDVTIIDQRGQLLFQKPTTGMEPAFNSLLEMQKGVEEYLSNKAQSMLDQILGKDRALVRIHVDLEQSEQKEIHETYNPDNQTIQSETVRTHKVQDNVPEGATGSRAKVKKTEATGKQKEEQEENRETKYALDKVVKEIANKAGSIKRISLALVVDQPLAGQLEQIGKLAQEAVGLEPKRGDTYQGTTLPFHQLPPAKEIEPITGWQAYYPLVSLARYLAMPLTILILGWMLIALFKKTATPPLPTHPKDAAVVPAAIAGAAVVETFPNTLREVRQIAKERPQETSAILRQWFNKEL